MGGTATEVLLASSLSAEVEMWFKWPSVNGGSDTKTLVWPSDVPRSAQLRARSRCRAITFQCHDLHCNVLSVHVS